MLICIPSPSCIIGWTSALLFTRRRETRCQGWSRRVLCGNRRRRGYSFFRSSAGRRCRRTNRFGRPARRGSQPSTQRPPRPYIDHAALLLLYGGFPVSPSEREPQAPPTDGYCGARTPPQQPMTTTAAMSCRRRRHPSRRASNGRSRRTSLGGCQF